jgi:hypothetical protein
MAKPCQLGNEEPYSREYPGHERVKFSFYEGYDGEYITATAYRAKRVWTKGTGWMKWLRFFTKEKRSDDLSLNFDKEVGCKKGSWKGGVVGHGVSVKPMESAYAACVRYCEENGHKFVDFIRNEDGHRVYKNTVEKQTSKGAKSEL